MREPGIYYDISNEAYHAEKTAIGASGLKAILEAPAYYFGQYLDLDCPKESEIESAGRRFGTMLHCRLFEPAAFSSRYRVGPEVASRALKAWKDFAATLPQSCEGIKPGEYRAMERCWRSVNQIPDVATALAIGHGEVSAYWRDEATGVLCKCRPDWVHDVGDDSVILLDGKSYASADGGEFSRQAARMRYPLQAAHYSEGYAKASGKKVLAFIFLAVADSWPHLANAIMLDEVSMEAGRAQWRRALDTYAACFKSGEWPGHGNDIKLITLPHWALEEFS